MEKTILDPKIINNFKQAFMKRYYGFIVFDEMYVLGNVVGDRVNKAVSYINSLATECGDLCIRNEQELILFMVYACIIVDASKIMTEKTGVCKAFDFKDTFYFKDICRRAPINLSDGKELNDYQFFYRYLRSLVFAHPFGIEELDFLKNSHDKHYTYGIDISISHMSTIRISVMSLSGKYFDEPLLIPLSRMKDFIKFRYNLLQHATNFYLKQYNDIKNKCQEIHFNLHKSEIDIVNDVSEAMNKIQADTCFVNKLVKFLDTKIENEKNRDAVERFQNYIKEQVPIICKAFNEFNFEEIESIVLDITGEAISGIGEDTFTYLNEIENETNKSSPNLERVKHLLHLCNDSFASKWVDLNDNDIEDYNTVVVLYAAAFMETKRKLDNNEDKLQ